MEWESPASWAVECSTRSKQVDSRSERVDSRSERVGLRAWDGELTCLYTSVTVVTCATLDNVALLSPIRTDEAVRRGDLVYELILSNWGNWGAAKDGLSLQFPVGSDAIPSVSGLAIAPRSDIDRVFVRHAVHRPLPSPVHEADILEAETAVSVDAPFIGQLPGPITIRSDPAHWYTDRYVPANSSPSTLPAFGTAFSGFVNPELRLLLYLGPKPVLPPRGRAPRYIETTRSFSAAEIGTEALLKVVPAMGRRRSRITFAVTGGSGPGANVDVRVTGTFTSVTTTGTSVTDVRVQEIPLAGPITISASANGVATFALENPNVSFLLLKATPAVVSTVRAAIEVQD